MIVACLVCAGVSAVAVRMLRMEMGTNSMSRKQLIARMTTLEKYVIENGARAVKQFGAMFPLQDTANDYIRSERERMAKSEVEARSLFNYREMYKSLGFHEDEIMMIVIHDRDWHKFYKCIPHEHAQRIQGRDSFLALQKAAQTLIDTYRYSTTCFLLFSFMGTELIRYCN